MRTQTLSIMLRLRIMIVCSVILGAMASCLAMANTRNSMQEYRFNISEYELSFSVPKVFISDSYGRPDKHPPESRKGMRGEGFITTYFFQVHMFKGPIWMGNYAAMDFTVQEFEADDAYSGPVSTLRELEEYQRWQLEFANNFERYDFSRKIITEYAWLKMALVHPDTGRTGKHDDENTIFLFPISDRRYLQILCRITELVPSKTNKWLEDAHEMRDQILDSIVLRKK